MSPEALVSSGMLTCSFSREHVSVTVQMRPPNCFNARLENRKGVIPGTTSMPSQSSVPSVAFKGSRSLRSLVRVWLLPNRNLTELLTCLILRRTLDGICCNSPATSLLPITHRLAPVSTIACTRSGISTKLAGASVGRSWIAARGAGGP